MRDGVTVVIRCYNEEQHIGRLLSGIMQQTVQDVEIVVVDSGSTDATLAIASRYPARVLSISPDEFSFGRSLNIGCQAATGAFIVVASAHVYPVYKNWLEHLLAPFSDPQIALVYGKQRGDKTSQYAEHRVFAQWFPDESRRRQNHPFCNNANAAIRRKLWAELPYDEELTGLEDLDWAKRAMALGCHLAYAAEAEVIHVHSETPRQTYNRYRREAIAFKQIFPEERFRLLDLVRLWLVNTLSDYRHGLQDGVLGRELLAIPRFRMMQFYGTYRGYAQHKPISQQLRYTFYYPNQRRTARPVAGGDRSDVRIHYDTID
jgi:rhamnosyltransferase